ncbi:MAG: hypothetical protein ACRDFQ_01835 [Anaerolineales bacterium]
MRSKKLTEIKLQYLLPVLFGVAALVNLAISRPLAFGLTGFSPVSLHANAAADYSRDPLDLIFPVLDPDIMVDAFQDRASEPAAVGSNALATPTPATGATPTPTGGLVPPLPTNTLTDPILTVVETLVPTELDPALATAMTLIGTLDDTTEDIVNTLSAPLDTILTTVPCSLPLQLCP